MNKKQTRLFAIASTAIASLVFLALTIDSHRQFPKLTNAENITPAVIARQGRLAQVQLHQLPHPVRRGRLLRAGPDQDHAASRRAVPAGLHARSVAVLRRAEASPPDAEAEPGAAGDHRPDRLSRLGQQGRQPGLAAASDPGDRRLHPGHGPVGCAAGAAAEQRAGEQLPPGARPVTQQPDPMALGPGAVPLGDAGLHRLPFDRAGREPGRPDARRPRRPAPQQLVASPDYKGAGEGRCRLHPRVDRRAQPRTWSRARCTRPAAPRSCRTPTART